jgi:hypothetical protein
MSVAADTNGRSHTYHAEASVLEGHLELPLEQQIKPQAYAKLNPEGGYLSQHAKDYKLEGVISFRSAYTQVAGNLDVKPRRGWTTLVTSVVEGLNILDVLTADRVVGQIATEHPLVGYVPSISFLGTRFDNLRIAGHPVKLEVDPNILGARPLDDTSYTTNAGVIDRVSTQYKRMSEQHPLPDDLQQQYNQLASTLGKSGAVECSLVNQCSLSHPAAPGQPGLCFGHVIKVPGFGTITLAKLRLIYEEAKEEGQPDVIKKTTTHLTMIDLKLGCAVAGCGSAAVLSTNGHTHP